MAGTDAEIRAAADRAADAAAEAEARAEIAAEEAQQATAEAEDAAAAAAGWTTEQEAARIAELSAECSRRAHAAAASSARWWTERAAAAGAGTTEEAEATHRAAQATARQAEATELIELTEAEAEIVRMFRDSQDEEDNGTDDTLSPLDDTPGPFAVVSVSSFEDGETDVEVWGPYATRDIALIATREKAADVVQGWNEDKAWGLVATTQPHTWGNTLMGIDVVVDNRVTTSFIVKPMEDDAIVVEVAGGIEALSLSDLSKDALTDIAQTQSLRQTTILATWYDDHILCATVSFMTDTLTVHRVELWWLGHEQAGAFRYANESVSAQRDALGCLQGRCQDEMDEREA